MNWNPDGLEGSSFVGHKENRYIKNELDGASSSQVLNTVYNHNAPCSTLVGTFVARLTLS